MSPRSVQKAASEVSVAEEPSPSGGSGGGEKWMLVVPLGALPRGERRVIIQERETILLLWYKDEVFAIENTSPAEGAYSEGLINAKLTKVTFNFIVYNLFPFLFASVPCITYFMTQMGIVFT